MVNTFLMPFFALHSAIGSVTCGSVIEKRAMYGDLVVMTEEAAFMTIIGIFACVASGATARAFGVKPKPAMKSTLSCVIRSCARRLAISGEGPVVSFSTSSTFLPATVSPCCFMYALIPLWICLPYPANGPENSATRPTLMVPSARAPWANSSAATAAIVLTKFMLLPSAAADRAALCFLEFSEIEESGLPFALQDDIETVRRAAVLPAGEKRAAHRRFRDPAQHRVAVVGRLVREVDPRHQLLEQPAREDGQVDVRSFQRPAPPSHTARPDGHEPVPAGLVGQGPAESVEARIGRAPIVGMVVAALRVRLPDLQDGVVDGRAVAVEHAALDDDLLAARTVAREVVPLGPVEPQPEERAHRLRGRGGLAAHRGPSKGVDSRPRRTTSKRYPSAYSAWLRPGS